jgi:hypothetical protein
MNSVIFTSLIPTVHGKDVRMKILMDLFANTFLRVLTFRSLAKNEFWKYKKNLIKDHVSVLITKTLYLLRENYCLTQKLHLVVESIL